MSLPKYILAKHTEWNRVCEWRKQMFFTYFCERSSVTILKDEYESMRFQKQMNLIKYTQIV